MPVYEYKCKKCGYVFESLIFSGEKEPEKCPVCKGGVQKVISGGVGFIFKGSGFYATDYKNKKRKEQETEKAKSSVEPARVNDRKENS